MTASRRYIRLLACFAGLTLLVAACGDDDDSNTQTDTEGECEWSESLGSDEDGNFVGCTTDENCETHCIETDDQVGTGDEDDDPPEDGPPPTTVEIDGVSYTCGEVIGAQGCGAATQAVFDEYGGNLETYVYSGQLGPLNDDSFGNRAFAGLVACVYGEDDVDSYLDFMSTDPVFRNYPADDLAPAFLEAFFTLCPTGFQSSDMTLP